MIPTEFFLEWEMFQAEFAKKVKTQVAHLKTKRRPLHLKTQSVPRCKRFLSQL